jgi:hypothetical protein
MVEQEEEATFEVALAAVIPQADLFHRARPASLEGPSEAWELATNVIDYGCALFDAITETRQNRQIRDLVLGALLRRATVTTEGIIRLLSCGLQEPAMALTRTLLDIDVSMKLVCQDESDRMARRLAAYHYIVMQQHGEDMLANHETRTRSLETVGRINEVRSIASSYKRLLQQGALADVETEVRASRFWHGLASVEEAFKATGQVADYHTTYDTGTWFVHAANVEHDLIESSKSGVAMRALVERNPKMVQTVLGYSLLRYVMIVGVFVNERGLPSTEHFRVKSEVRFPDGCITEIDSFTALSMQVSKYFDPPEHIEPAILASTNGRLRRSRGDADASGHLAE